MQHVYIFHNSNSMFHFWVIKELAKTQQSKPVLWISTNDDKSENDSQVLEKI